jgi:hypothetical protein
MAQYGMGDDATINEVIEDVDTDKVINFLISFSTSLLSRGGAFKSH